MTGAAEDRAGARRGAGRPQARPPTPLTELPPRALPEPITYHDHEHRLRLHNRRPALTVSHRAYCPRRHRIPESADLLAVDSYKCVHVMPGGHECGIRLYILGRMTRRNEATGDVEHLLYAVEVTRDELRVVRELSTPDALEFLQTGY